TLYSYLATMYLSLGQHERAFSMDIVDRNKIKSHPAAILARRASQRRQAKPATIQPTTRADIERQVAEAFTAKFPTYELWQGTVKFYGCIHLWQLSAAQLREFHDRIINA